MLPRSQHHDTGPRHIRHWTPPRSCRLKKTPQAERGHGQWKTDLVERTGRAGRGALSAEGVQVVYSLLPLLYFFLLATLLLLSSCRHEGVRSALPGLRGLLGVRLPVDVPVAPCFREFLVYVLRFRCIRHFVINVINNIRTRFIISFYVICAMIYCSFCCIYV